MPLFTKAQERHTLSGHIKDAASGEELIGASVYLKELGTGAVANVYGFYSVTVASGKYVAIYSFVGYESKEVAVDLSKDFRLDIELAYGATELEEIVVSAERVDQNVTSTSVGVNKLEIQEIAKIPVVFGEKDIIKTMQLLPGITSSEANGGFYVRGGSADQNLILLDEAPVYNASHLLGFFSVFNSDAIKDVTIYKGGIPAEYGGRASSVIDIIMKDGNAKKFSANGGLGAISSRLTLEAPIVRDKGSFMVSGRRTYADLFLKLSNDKDINSSSLYFYDLNLKANYRLGKNDRIYLSGYFGRDNFGFSDLFGFDWGNKTATLRWNHIFNNKLFLNSTLIYSDYNYKVEVNGDGVGNELKITSAIRDFDWKEDFDYFVNPNNTIKFGTQLIYHTFIPGEITSGPNSSVNNIELQKKYALEGAAYISNETSLSEQLKLEYGIRYSSFSQLGPGTVNTYDQDGEVIDTKSYQSGDLIKTYGGFEPRLSASYILNPQSSIKASYGRSRQYLHLLSNSTSTTPTDLWIPSSAIVKPQIADQVSLGYFRNLKDNQYESSVEVYYKDMKNQIDYKTGAQLLFNESVESQLLFGKGWSYGAEFFLKKKTGKLNGWISYTWAKTERQFDLIDFGEAFPAPQNRTHNASVVGIWQINEKWTLSGAWVYSSGRAVTYPVGKYNVEGTVVNLYDKRNSDKMPDYHRLDLSATLIAKKTKRFESSWNFSIYNAYARKNAFAIQFREKENDPTQTEAVKLTLYSILPTVTYNFKF